MRFPQAGPGTGRRLRWAPIACTAALALVAGGCGDSEDDAAQSEPAAGSWKAWVPATAQLTVPAPPADDSAAATRDEAGLKAAVAARTPRQEQIARNYGTAPVVAPWLDTTMELVSRRPKDPPSSSRSYGYVSAALEDAVIAAYRMKYKYKRDAPDGDESPDPSYPSAHAAMAGAASRLIGYLYPEYPAARLSERADDVGEALVASGANYPSDVAAGLQLGRKVAELYIEQASKDGYGRKWNGKRPHGPARWEPPPGSTSQPIQPLAGTWETWLLKPVERFQPPAPPKYGTKQFIANARDVMRVKEQLTPRQKRLAKFWEAGPGTALPAGVWNKVVLAYKPAKELSVPRQARLFAMLNVAMADAGAAAWNAKFQTGWWDPRPINAIRDLGLDKTWEPLLGTPSFPAYPSGTSNYSGAAGEVLAHVFGDDAEMWRARAADAGMSRLWGGVHWRIDVTQGLKMGRQVGGLVVDRAKTDGAET